MQKIDLIVNPSRNFLLFLLLLHISAVIVLMQLDVSKIISMSVAMLIAYSAYYAINRYALRNVDDAIIAIAQRVNQEWLLVDRRGKSTIAKLKSAFRSNLLIIMYFKIPGKWRGISVPIFKDAVNAEQFRRLYVVLGLETRKK